MPQAPIHRILERRTLRDCIGALMVPRSRGKGTESEGSVLDGLDRVDRFRSDLRIGQLEDVTGRHVAFRLPDAIMEGIADLEVRNDRRTLREPVLDILRHPCPELLRCDLDVGHEIVLHQSVNHGVSFFVCW